MVQHHGETPDKSISSPIEGMSTNDQVERRASARMLEEPQQVKIDARFESPEGLKLLNLASNPERHPGGVPGFHIDSINRIEKQNERIASGCSAEEMMAMHNNNTYMIEAQQRRMQELLQKSQRASLAPVIRDGALTFS